MFLWSNRKPEVISKSEPRWLRPCVGDGRIYMPESRVHSSLSRISMVEIETGNQDGGGRTYVGTKMAAPHM